MAAAELPGLMAGDAAAFERLIEQLMSPQNEARQQAEEAFNKCKEQPDTVVAHLVAGLRRSPQPQSRAFCAVLLRKVLTKDDPSLWPTLSPATQALVKTELLNCMKEEPERSNLKKVADTVAELAAGVVEAAPGWPELLPFIFQGARSGSERVVEAALLVFGQLARHVMGTLTQYLGTLHEVLAGCAASNNLDVRVAALRATAAFVQELEDPATRNKFADLVPAALATLGAALNAGEEVAAQEVLELLIETAEAHPLFFKRQLADVVAAMLQVTDAEALEDSTRQLAAELLVTLCEAREKAPGMMRKLPQFLGRLFQSLMAFLLDIEDEATWHSADSDAHENDGEGERYEIGQEALDRLSLALGGNAIVPLASALLPQWMVDADWRKRHAALISLAQIAEGCVKVMTKQAGGLVDMCLTGLQDPHARVRWAACQALGQMCTDLGPDIQTEQHARILPGLMAVMEDFSAPRVQAHAAAAVVNFSEGADPDLLPPYLDALIARLLALLQNGKKLVQEGALTAMASVADCAKSAFEKYYDNVMPLLRAILFGASDKAHWLLRAKSLECISLVGMAVGKERFRGDAHEVMTFMQALQGQKMEDDDPTASYMLQAGARICKTLGPEFLPYLAVVMPPLLASAQLKPDVHITDADDEAPDEDEDDEEVETIYLGDRKISIRTSVLEEKATACNMLCCYADELKEGFYPYVEQVTHIMVPLLKFYFHEDVRQAAVAAMPELLTAALRAVEAGKGPTPAFVKQMLDFIWPPLMEAMSKEPDNTVMTNMLEAVEAIVDTVGPAYLTPDQLGAAFERFKLVLDGAAERRLERLARQSHEDFDEEEAEALQGENEEEEDLLDSVSSALTAILRKFGDGAMVYVDALMPQIGGLLDKSRAPEERRVGLCIMDDVLEHAPTGAAKYMAQMMPVLLAEAASRDPNIRQCSVYGLGVAAQHQRDAFAPYLPDALARLSAVISQPDARSEDNAMATENAISALGKLLEFSQPGALDGRAVGTLWVNALPLRADLVEAKLVHAQLVRLVEASDARVLGEGNAHLPRIVAVMVEVLGKGDKLAEGATVARMVQLLQQMQSTLPQEVFQGFYSQLQPKEQATLQAAMAGRTAVPH